MINITLVTCVSLITCSKYFLDIDTEGKLEAEEFFGWYMLKTLPSNESNSAGANTGIQPALQALDKFIFDSEKRTIMRSGIKCTDCLPCYSGRQ